jgi:uncharacterized phage-like protein YoqJ
MIITFCGHSHFQKTKEYEEKIHSVLENIVGKQSAYMYLGGYGEFDEFAYECCKNFKKTHNAVSLVFITPYITMEYQKNRLEYEKNKYDIILYPEIENKPLRFAISYRNKWMVDKSDYVICAIEHTWGGAYKTYRYAMTKKKNVINILEFSDM